MAARRRRLRAEDGATTVEYGMLAAAVGVVVAAAAPTLVTAMRTALDLITGGMLGG